MDLQYDTFLSQRGHFTKPRHLNLAWRLSSRQVPT